MPSAPHLSPALLALAATQRGVFTSAQARERGHSANELQRLRRHRILVSVRRGVYALREEYAGATPITQHGMRVGALALVLQEPAVLSHGTAAVELELEVLDNDLSLLHVTRSGAAGTRVEAGVDHHSAELPAGHVMGRRDQLDVTTPARTAVDVARETNRLECAVSVFDSALRMGVSREELTDLVIRCRNWPGARMATRALGLADGRAANPGESWSRVVLVAGGVPPDDLQVPLYDADGLIGYVDFGWDGVIGEHDGRGKYGIGSRGDASDDSGGDPKAAAERLWREKKREDRIRALGYEVARWTYADHYRPGVIAFRVREAMARRAARWRSG